MVVCYFLPMREERLPPMDLRRTTVAVLVLLGGSACASTRTTIAVNGATFDVSSSEADTAAELDQQATGSASARCNFWAARKKDAYADGSKGFRAWVDAERRAACSKAPDPDATSATSAVKPATTATVTPSDPSSRRYLVSPPPPAVSVGGAVLQPSAGPPGVPAYRPRDNEIGGAFTLSYFEMPSERLVRLAENTSVDVVRTGRGNGVNFALVRIVDAGGLADRGSLFIVLANRLAPAPTGAPPSRAAAPMREAAAVAQQALSEDVRKELETGRCTDAHATEMQHTLQRFTELLDGRMRGDPVSVVEHALLVATDAGTSTSLTVGLPGEAHVFAVGYDPKLALKVSDAQGYAVQTESRYAERADLLRLASRTRTRMLQANGMQRLNVTVTGQGCVLVFLARKY